MKRLIYIYMVLGMMMASCTLERSDNGEMDGMWLMQTVDTLSTGGTADVREKFISWSFQVHLMQLRHPKHTLDFHFQHEGNLLILKDVFIDDRMNGDPAVTDIEMLKEVGLSQLQDTFSIVSLDSENLDIANRQYCYHFRRY